MAHRQPRRTSRRAAPDRFRRRAQDRERSRPGAQPDQAPGEACVDPRLAGGRSPRARRVDQPVRDPGPAERGRSPGRRRSPQVLGEPSRDRLRGPLMSAAAGELTYEVLVVDGQPIPGRPAPDGSPSMWSPTSATLICGATHAVLIDGLTTKEHAAALVAWVAGRGLALQTIYVTHGHGDHFFGLGPLVAEHPGVEVVALPDVVDRMREQTSPEVY